MKVYKGNKRKEFFYLIGQMTVHNEVRYHVCIFEKGKEEVHIFSRFFTDKMGSFSLKNKSKGTIERFYLTFIIRFLNYIFNDSKTAIDNIEDLTLDMVEEFLDNFSRGTLPEDTLGRCRSTDSVERATRALSYFVYWLFWKKVPNTRKKMFKMKNLKSEDFEFYTKSKKNKHNDETVQVQVLSNIVEPFRTGNNYPRAKCLTPGKYSIEKLIDMAKEKDPMITFAIVLASYAGLRLGDICQLFQGRIIGLEKGVDFGAYFDFTYNTTLRSDNVETSSCKTKRCIPIYEGCTSTINYYYEEHLKYLKYKNLYHNKYGALFIDNNGKAMTARTLQRRFNKIEELVDLVIKEEAMLGNQDAKKECKFLAQGKITVQSLRRYYKQLIDTIEGSNKRKTQYYMTHKDIKTQEEYGVAPTTEENIRKCQNELYIPIKENLKYD